MLWRCSRERSSWSGKIKSVLHRDTAPGSAVKLKQVKSFSVYAARQIRALRSRCSQILRPDGGAALADADAEDRRQAQAGQRLRRLLQDVTAGGRVSAQTSHLNPVSPCLCLTQLSTCLQVCGVLESLEQEYRREEDWCGGGERQPEQLMPLINKHMEQKEAFLKVRGLRKTIVNCFVSIACCRGQGCM